MKTREEKIKERNERWEKEQREIEASKAGLAREFGLERNAKFERAWEIAWGLGHASGFSEVENHFRELADLLKP